MPRSPADTDADTGDTDLVDALSRTAFVVTGVLSRVAAEHEVSLTQMRVLGILRDHRPRMAELAAYLGLEKSTMSGLVERGERRGLLARTASPEDRRAVLVSLTGEGARLAQQGYDEVREALLPLVDPLGPEEQVALGRLLRSMLATPG